MKRKKLFFNHYITVLQKNSFLKMKNWNKFMELKMHVWNVLINQVGTRNKNTQKTN